MRSVRAIAMAAAMLVVSAGVASAQSAQPAQPAQSAQPAMDQMTGRHTMEGKVTSVSAKTGWVHVKTSEGTIIVHLPPASLADVKKGDTISVDLALKDNGPAKPKAAAGK